MRDAGSLRPGYQACLSQVRQKAHACSWLQDADHSLTGQEQGTVDLWT